MSVILTKYSSVDLPPNDEFNICFQLNKRCQQLPKEVTLAYFTKALNLHEQYRSLIAGKSARITHEYAF